MVKVAPSILAADWSRLGDEVKAAISAGADWIHLDVMDGHFVPPITFGPGVVSAVRKATDAFLDVHLMIEKPENQIEAFAAAGADLISVHLEAAPHLHRLVQQIKEQGKKAGVALNPATPVSLLKDIIEDIDLILIMSVNPGWGGQKFIPQALRRVEEAAKLIKASGRPIELEVDGGITDTTAPQALRAGATALVAGTYVFQNKDYRAAMESLRK